MTINLDLYPLSNAWFVPTFLVLINTSGLRSGSWEYLRCRKVGVAVRRERAEWDKQSGQNGVTIVTSTPHHHFISG